MVRILDLYYQFWANDNLVQVTKDHEIGIDFIVEAGCHDGSDTKRLAEEFPTARIFAFEPDQQAREKALKLLRKFPLGRVFIFNYAISNTNEERYLKYLNGIPGTGSSEIRDCGEVSVKLRRLDDCIQVLAGESGLLWLDVEGHAIQALQGMRMTLKNIKAAKIEIQMHKMSESRVKDYDKVIEILGAEELLPIFAPLHPGYFGDIIFIKKSYLSKLELLKSKCLIYQLKILHDYIFPILGKT